MEIKDFSCNYLEYPNNLVVVNPKKNENNSK